MILKPTSIQASQSNSVMGDLGAKLGLFTQMSQQQQQQQRPPVQAPPKTNDYYDDFEDLDDIAELIEQAEMEMENQKEQQKENHAPIQIEKEAEQTLCKAKEDDSDFTFDFEAFMTQTQTKALPQNVLPDNSEIRPNKNFTQFSDNKMFPPQEKRIRQIDEELDNDNDAPRHFIDLSQIKSQKPTITLTQASKKDRIEIESTEIKYEKSQVYRRPTPSPLFKVKQQSGKNPKMINLGVSESWKKGLSHLGINAPAGLSEEANERVNCSLNELNFYTVAQIKGGLCVNFKAPNLLVTLKNFEIHKDTATLVLMDLTGEITGSIIKSIVTEEVNNSIYAASEHDIASQIHMNSAMTSSYKMGEKVGLKVGMVFWFKNVTVFNPIEDTFYLTFCEKNIEQIFYE